VRYLAGGVQKNTHYVLLLQEFREALKEKMGRVRAKSQGSK
jgi:hypothetical protein